MIKSLRLGGRKTTDQILTELYLEAALLPLVTMQESATLLLTDLPQAATLLKLLVALEIPHTANLKIPVSDPQVVVFLSYGSVCILQAWLRKRDQILIDGVCYYAKAHVGTLRGYSLLRCVAESDGKEHTFALTLQAEQTFNEGELNYYRIDGTTMTDRETTYSFIFAQGETNHTIK